MNRPQGRPRALTPEQVIEVRDIWTKPHIRQDLFGVTDRPSQKALAEQYGVHPQTIFNVIHGLGVYADPIIKSLKKAIADGEDLGIPQRGPGITVD